MKIGMMLDMYKPYISGVTNHVETYADTFRRQGHDVKIFTFGDAQAAPVETDVFYTRGLPIHVPFADLTFNLNFRHPEKIVRLIQEMDIINVHHPFLSGNLAYQYCKNTKIPIVFTSHTRYDLYTQIYTSFLPQKLVQWILKTYLQSAVKKFDQVITPSSSSRKMYETFNIHANFKLIPNGINFSSSEKRNDSITRQTLGIKALDFVLIYVGRLGPEKNLSILLDTFYSLLRARKDVKLILVGKGTEETALRRKIQKLGIEDHVVFTGYVEYKNVFDYLKLSNAFFSLSNTEVHPLSILEAMSVGLPVIALDLPGINDMIKHHETGLLSPLNQENILKNLIFLVDHQDICETYGKDAQRVAQTYHVENTSKLVIDTYQKLIEKKNQVL